MHRFTSVLAVTALSCALAVSPALAQQDGPHPFEAGRFRISIGGTAGSSFGDSYFVIFAGVGYFVWDGLELGADSEFWLGGDPFFSKLSLQSRYVFFQLPVIHPYVGGFYRHWFIGDDLDDLDSVGGRVGAFYALSPNVFAGGGVVFERLLSGCEEDCLTILPEFGISATF